MSSMFSDEEWSPEGAAHLDFQKLEGTNCYLDPDSEKTIIQAFGSFPLGEIHWIDGGDFHYLSYLWLQKLTRPAALLLFDHHPDDQPPAFGPEILSCGGWVARARNDNPLLDDAAEDVYLSIDLDYLSTDYARTNWDQGDASLEQLLAGMDAALEGRTLVGVDICGGITVAQGGLAEDFSVNRKTRNALLEYFARF